MTTTSPSMESINTMDAFLPYLNDIRVPNSSDKIYKDECAYSFDTPVFF